MSNGIKRRDFLKVIGVSGAGAAVTGCSPKDAEKLLPYVVPPEDIVPGVSTWYTTVCGECAAGCGVCAMRPSGVTRSDSFSTPLRPPWRICGSPLLISAARTCSNLRSMAALMRAGILPVSRRIPQSV